MKLHYLILVLLLAACGKPAAQEEGTEESIDAPGPAPSVAAEPEPEQVQSAEPTDMQPEATTVQTEAGTLVYVTEDGDKYHTADCRYTKTAHAVKLSEAKAEGKTACGICKPNSRTGEKQVRCSGTTAEGKQCQRMTTDPSGKCFQHKDS